MNLSIITNMKAPKPCLLVKRVLFGSFIMRSDLLALPFGECSETPLRKLELNKVLILMEIKEIFKNSIIDM